MENKYLDYNYYLNNKTNLISNIRLKKYIKNNNRLFINKSIKNDLKINNYLLDNDQKESIYTDEKNILVLAGAGSGKTLTIAGKINYLIEEKGIKKDEILCLSFTNESVKSLKDKVNYDIDIYTFHKLAIEILKDYNLSFNIINNYLEYIVEEIFLSIINNIDIKTLNYFIKTITSFINIFKTYNYDIKKMNNLTKKNKSKLLKVIKNIYLIYEDELRSSGLIDFNDLIEYATNIINKKGLKRYYKYIIIDEFQDISKSRYLLIKSIQESCNSKLFVVGDDYQSIYKFAGSNINMIIDFKKYFGYTKIIKIKKTYRNSKELIEVTSKFILKNRSQIKKKLLSDKELYKPIKIIYYKNNMSIKFKKLLDDLDNVMILGRNNFDINMIIDDDITYSNGVINYNVKEYSYKSVHKSKGLEEDNIIIINMTNNIYGFPNKKKKDIESLILPKDKYLYEEERRLFYVALTRSKNYVYLFVDKTNPSIFIKEIIRNSKKYIEVLDL